MAAPAPRRSRLCPCCKRVLSIRRWRLDDKLFGEDRDCPDTRCGYKSSWTCNERLGEIRGTSFMRSNSIRTSAPPPTGMVPGGEA